MATDAQRRHDASVNETPKTPAAHDMAAGAEHIMQVGFGFWASKVLLSAVELELFSRLAEAPGTADDLRERLRLHPRAVVDFLDALVALGFLEREDGVYRNTPAAALFLDRGSDQYIGGILEMANARLFGFWNHLTEALQTGNPQSEARHGDVPFFEALYADPERLRQFLEGMTGVSRIANAAIASAFPWGDHASFVDVGTAQGDLAVQVARAHPHVKGIGFDLPPVKPIFEDYARAQHVDDRLQFVAGDFFADPLPAADVVMMGHILHDWDLEQKKQLIRKAHDALPDGGALIVYEAIIDDQRRENVFGLLLSLNMLVETPGGFDYTASDCLGWMAECGFRDGYVQHLAGPDSMVVAFK